jgi:hypothetical protein
MGHDYNDAAAYHCKNGYDQAAARAIRVPLFSDPRQGHHRFCLFVFKGLNITYSIRIM